MPYNDLKEKESVRSMIKRAETEIYIPLCDLSMEAYITPEPVTFAERMSGNKKVLKKGEYWGKIWDCGWFHFTGMVPERAKGKKIVMYVDIHGELCIFDKDGTPVQGLTSGSSAMNPACGSPKKREYVITECARGGELVDLWADAGCNDLFGVYPEVGKIEYVDLCVCKDNVKALYYDAVILEDLCEQLPENSARYQKILKALFDASCQLWDFTDEEVETAREILKKELDKKGGDPSLKLSFIGHAHIDLAWEWPIRETKRKAVRTFATALRNMEKYPDYVFGASQPQLYQWVKEDYPNLYAQVKKRITEGRWEPQGAMWVEADTNITGGEAIIRQILYGKRFFLREFGKDMEILWLPDVFGYSGALPQIMKKSNVPYFLTIKLSWNQHNTHPHHTFLWKGIDGSEILVHMPPEGEYNSKAMPCSIKKAEQNYLDKNVCEEALELFGIGDGGGGPGESHLEALKREKNLEGLVPATQEQAVKFFHRLDDGREKYQTFKGELYLEKHQGTYTTQARNKWYNRKMEILLREAEFAAVVTHRTYPQKELEAIWKEVLLYQFHDILPGSAIKRVYDESLQRYAALYLETKTLIKNSYGEGNFIINSLSWDRRMWAKKDKIWYLITIPAMGSAELKCGRPAQKKPAENTGILENDSVRILFGSNGAIVSVYDKQQKTEVLEQQSNRFAIYYDDGDCWDFNETYRERAPRFFALVNVQAFTDGPVNEIVQEYAFGNSNLKQTISITEGSTRVVFDTEVDWKESQKMLRTAFYTNIVTDEVTCDIQYGNIKRPTHRNTSLDMAKFEISAHKYVDLSDGFHGVALLNDCKYGYCVKDGMIDVNLLRSPNYPGKQADIAHHVFRYALYPHTGDLAHSDVIQKSYEFNIPPQFGKETEQFVFVDNPDIVIESVKKAEDRNSIIIRLYESKGVAAEAGLHFAREVTEAYIVDMMEGNRNKIDLKHIHFHGFEINTIEVILRLD